MLNFKLPFWLNAGDAKKIKQAVDVFYSRLKGWLVWIVEQRDPLTCHEKMLRLLAWEKGVDRFETEDTPLFRLRVAYADDNTADAGSAAGMLQILARLGVQVVGVDERVPGSDWDVIRVNVTNKQLSLNLTLLGLIVQHYGRTCRRYQVTVAEPVAVDLAAYAFSLDSRFDVAS